MTPKVIYEGIARKGIHYYNIFGLTIYASCSDESKKREYAQKIADFARSLESSEFTAHSIIFEKPKIYEGKLLTTISNRMEPEDEACNSE